MNSTGSIASRYVVARHSRSLSEAASVALHRKRKSAVDLARVLDSLGEDAHENVGLVINNGVFVDTKPRSRRASLQQMAERDRRKNANDIFLMCPDDNCRPPEFLVDESDEESDLEEYRSMDRSEGSASAFRFPAKIEESSAGSCIHSPTGVEQKLVRHGDVYFWQRSRAWSEERSDSEDDERTDNRFDFSSAIRNHQLTVPALPIRGVGAENQRNISRSSRPLRSRRQSPQHRRTVSLNIFRPPSPTINKTAEIYWEEKVLESDDLERMAKISLRDN